MIVLYALAVTQLFAKLELSTAMKTHFLLKLLIRKLDLPSLL